MKVVELRHTCYAMPAQWEGRCNDGKWVYVRYRFGWLSIVVGEGEEALREIGREVFAKHCGGSMDGDMTFEELCQHAPGIEWPHEAEPLTKTWLEE